MLCINHVCTTAFPTPRRLVQSQLKSPGFGFPAETSVDLFASPLCTPSRITPLRMIQSTMNTPMVNTQIHSLTLIHSSVFNTNEQLC